MNISECYNKIICNKWSLVFFPICICLFLIYLIIINYLTKCYDFSNLKYLTPLSFLFSLRAQETYKRHSEEKFVCDMIAFQKACERLQDAKAKIESVKTKVVVKIPSGMTKWTNTRAYPMVILNYSHYFQLKDFKIILWKKKYKMDLYINLKNIKSN